MGARGYGGRWRNGAGFLWISRPAVRPRRCSALGGELGSVRFAVGGTSWAQTVWSRGRMTEEAFVELARDRTVSAPGVPAAPSWDVELDLGGGTVLRVRRPSAC